MTRGPKVAQIPRTAAKDSCRINQHACARSAQIQIVFSVFREIPAKGVYKIPKQAGAKPGLQTLETHTLSMLYTLKNPEVVAKFCNKLISRVQNNRKDFCALSTLKGCGFQLRRGRVAACLGILYTPCRKFWLTIEYFKETRSKSHEHKHKRRR